MTTPPERYPRWTRKRAGDAAEPPETVYLFFCSGCRKQEPYGFIGHYYAPGKRCLGRVSFVEYTRKEDGLGE